MHSPHAFLVNGDVFFDPHPRQLAVMQRLAARVAASGDYQPSKKFIYGNRGGGKSVLIRAFLHAMALTYPGLTYVVVRRNMPDLRSNHLIYVGPEMRKLGGEYHETHGIATYANGSRGFYRQCEEERDVEKIVGAEAAILFVDEAPQIKWEHLRTMAPSLRVATDKQTGQQPYRTLEVYSGNPIGESIDEFWRYFVEQDVDRDEDPQYDPLDWEAMPMLLSDNPSLNEAEYLKQFAGIPAHYRAAWIDGVRMDSRTLFDVKKTKDGQPYHYISELPTIDGVPITRVPWVQWYRAFDMGYFPDPAYCLWLAVVGKRVIAVEEGIWFKTIAKDLAAKMIERTKELTNREDAQIVTYVDPSINIKTGSDTVTVMDTLEMHGVPCEASINDRVLYADAIHGLLGEEIEPGVPRFQIYEPGCPVLARYLPKYRWDEKNPRKMADHKFDHPGVTLAYFAISSGVLSRTEASSTTSARPVWMDWMDEDTAPRRRRRAV